MSNVVVCSKKIHGWLAGKLQVNSGNFPGNAWSEKSSQILVIRGLKVAEKMGKACLRFNMKTKATVRIEYQKIDKSVLKKTGDEKNPGGVPGC